MVSPFPQRGFLPADNPISKFVDPRRSALMGLSAGLLSGNPGNAMTGAMQGAQVDQQYAAQQAEVAKQAEQQNMTKEWLRAKGREDLLPLVDAGQGMFALQEATKVAQGPKPGDNLMNVGGNLYDTVTGEWISPPANPADNRQNVSLTPQWGQDAQGNWVMLQPSSTGELVQSSVPEGVSLVNPFDLNANKAGGTTYGKGIGAAQLDLPGANLIAEQTIQAINDVRAEKAGMAEQFGKVLGIPQQMLPTVPQSERAQFQVAADRAINRAFLQGREMLKGAGQITDFESRKAEAAITAAQAAMEKGDQGQFLKALDDFEQAVRDGNAKIQAQSQAMPGYGGGQQRPAQGQTSTGLTWSVTK